MFLMSRKIKSLGVKMVISGEGSDEIFGGYLYFHKAPNKEEFHLETCRKVLHPNDVHFVFFSPVAWEFSFFPRNLMHSKSLVNCLFFVTFLGKCGGLTHTFIRSDKSSSSV